MLDHFRFAHLRFLFQTLEPLALPALNKGNVLRGAFGLRFRQLPLASGKLWLVA